MADPFTMLAVAGTAFQAVGAIQQGNEQAAQYTAQANAMRYNQHMTRLQADAVAQQTAAREDLQRRQARQQIGRQAAAGAQSGVNFGGSLSDMMRDSLVNAEQDALNIRYEGDMERFSLNQQANIQGYEAGASDRAAKTARRTGRMNAVATLVGGATSYARGSGAMTRANQAGYSAFADRAGPIGSGSGGRPRTITGGR